MRPQVRRRFPKPDALHRLQRSECFAGCPAVLSDRRPRAGRRPPGRAHSRNSRAASGRSSRPASRSAMKAVRVPPSSPPRSHRFRSARPAPRSRRESSRRGRGRRHQAQCGDARPPAWRGPSTAPPCRGPAGRAGPSLHRSLSHKLVPCATTNTSAPPGPKNVSPSAPPIRRSASATPARMPQPVPPARVSLPPAPVRGAGAIRALDLLEVAPETGERGVGIGQGVARGMATGDRPVARLTTPPRPTPRRTGGRCRCAAERVGPRPAFERVGAAEAPEPVVACAADEGVVAGTASKLCHLQSPRSLPVRGMRWGSERSAPLRAICCRVTP